MATLKIVNSTGSYTATGITASALTSPGGTPITLPIVNFFAVVNADGTYTFDKVNTVIVAGSVGSVGAPASTVIPYYIVPTTFNGYIASVASPASITSTSVRVTGSVGSVATVSSEIVVQGAVSIAGAVGSVASPAYAATYTLKYAVSVGSIGLPTSQVTYKNGQDTVAVLEGVKTVGMPAYTQGQTVSFVEGIINGVGFISSITSTVAGSATQSNVVTGLVEAVAIPAALVIAKNFDLAMCKITMTLLKIDGEPVGTATQEMTTINNVLTVVEGWRGVDVTARIQTRDRINNKVITTDEVKRTTDSTGYAEFDVYQGKHVVIKCNSLGSLVTIDTTDLTTVDVSDHLA